MIFSESSILIVGLVRNCARTIESNIRKCESSFDKARKVKILVIESDSSDDTIDILHRLSETKENFSFLSLGVLRNEIPQRTARIAYCRNHYLTLLRENPEYAEIDYVVVADLDGVNAELNADAVMSCWDRDDWDVCSANQSGPYYDIWALRHRLWSPNDCWQQVRFLRSYGVSHFKSVMASVYSRMIYVSPLSEWIEVESAFGGLAIYRKAALVSGRYVGLTENGEEVCEHVALHSQIREKGGRIFINPAMINAGTVEHSKRATTFGLVVFWLRCQLLGLANWCGFIPYLKKVRAVIKG